MFDKERFFKPVDNIQVEIFRIFVGFLMVCESFGAIATGWVRNTLVEPAFTFNFIGLDFLQPLPGNVMYIYFGLMGIVSIAVMVGYRYRFFSILLALMWAGVYFMQKSSYNNHYYLMVLLLAFMASINPAKNIALDAKRKGIETTCPAWYNWFLMLQLFIVFTYAAVNKLYPGWQEGHFIRLAFNAKTDYWLIGPLLGQDWFQMAITYGGIFFDLLVIPALFWKRSRNFAFAGLVIFNLFNAVVFQIGIFPFLVLAFVVFFYEPEKIRKLFLGGRPFIQQPENVSYQNSWSFGLFWVYFLVQVLLPLRHHAIPGNVNWREEGHRLSWRMMLRSKYGYTRFEIENKQTGERTVVPLKEYLSKKQLGDVATKPDFIWQFSQRLKAIYKEKGMEDIAIFVTDSRVYLNGTGPFPLVAPTTDVAKVSWNYWGRNEWVLDMPKVE